MYNVKDWLSVHSEEIHEHVQPHCFKFTRNPSGKAVMYYRKWSTDTWMGPVQLLKVKNAIMSVIVTSDYVLPFICNVIWN